MESPKLSFRATGECSGEVEATRDRRSPREHERVKGLDRSRVPIDLPFDAGYVPLGDPPSRWVLAYGGRELTLGKEKLVTESMQQWGDLGQLHW